MNIDILSYNQYSIDELNEIYLEAKFMAFMYLHAGDKKNWMQQCRECAEIQLVIHTKMSEVA